jgi:hypothetical protein
MPGSVVRIAKWSPRARAPAGGGGGPWLGPGSIVPAANECQTSRRERAGGAASRAEGGRRRQGEASAEKVAGGVHGRRGACVGAAQAFDAGAHAGRRPYAAAHACAARAPCGLAMGPPQHGDGGAGGGGPASVRGRVGALVQACGRRQGRRPLELWAGAATRGLVECTGGRAGFSSGCQLGREGGPRRTGYSTARGRQARVGEGPAAARRATARSAGPRPRSAPGPWAAGPAGRGVGGAASNA